MRPWMTALDHDEPSRGLIPRPTSFSSTRPKKLRELLNASTFNRRFRWALLASFESLSRTTKLRRETMKSKVNFDNVDQRKDETWSGKGIYVHAVTKLSKDFRQKFWPRTSSPKMDALACNAECSRGDWPSGGLVFSTRVASVMANSGTD